MGSGSQPSMTSHVKPRHDFGERTSNNLQQFFVLSANFVPFDNGDSVKNFSFGAGRIVGMNIAFTRMHAEICRGYVASLDEIEGMETELTYPFVFVVLIGFALRAIARHRKPAGQAHPGDMGHATDGDVEGGGDLRGGCVGHPN